MVDKDPKKAPLGVLSEIASSVGSAMADIASEVKQDLKEMTPPPTADTTRAQEVATTVSSASGGLAEVEVPEDEPDMSVPLEDVMKALDGNGREIPAPWDAVETPGRVRVDAAFIAAGKEDINRYAIVAKSEQEEPVTVGIVAAEGADGGQVQALATALEQSPHLFGSIGFGPRQLQDDLEAMDAQLTTWLNEMPKLIALGPVGLDEPYAPYTLPQQKEQLTRQLEIAADFELPVFISHRRSFEALATLLGEMGTLPPLIWADPLNEAGELELVKRLGMYAVIRPELTYETNATYRDLIRQVPENRRLLAGGSALVAPEKRVGHSNGPESLPLTLKTYATLIDTPVLEVQQRLNRNAKALFVKE